MSQIAKLLAFILIVLIYSAPSDALAARKRYANSGGDITQSPKYASIVVNANTGEVLSKQGEHKVLHPASLTKMMTIYLAFQAIENRKLSLNQQLAVSSLAASKPPTRLNLKAGQTVSVKDALYGMIVHSANDAAVVLAEAIDGSEEAFAERMTKTARQLGMSNTVFMNAHGLHHPSQVTTASDMAKLGIALRRDYPKFYPLFSKKSFIFRGNVITSHNRVMNRYRWADGLKTGFISASGFNLVTSASRPEGRVVAVVLGGHSARARDDHMIALLDRGYERIIGKNPGTQVASIEKAPAVVETPVVGKSPTAFDIAENQPLKALPQTSIQMVANTMAAEAYGEQGSSTYDIEGIEDDLDKPISSLSTLPHKPVLRAAQSETKSATSTQKAPVIANKVIRTKDKKERMVLTNTPPKKPTQNAMKAKHKTVKSTAKQKSKTQQSVKKKRRKTNQA